MFCLKIDSFYFIEETIFKNFFVKLSFKNFAFQFLSKKLIFFKERQNI